MKSGAPDPAMRKALKLFEKSGKSLDQLGQEMGYEGDVARKSVWQFLHRTADPRLSMLRRFAKAMGISVKDLL
jgi:hypothetical protein